MVKKPRNVNRQKPLLLNPTGEPEAPIRNTTESENAEKQKAVSDLFEVLYAALRSEAYNSFALNLETVVGKNWILGLDMATEDHQTKTQRLEAEFEALLVNHHRLMSHFK